MAIKIYMYNKRKSCHNMFLHFLSWIAAFSRRSSDTHFISRVLDKCKAIFCHRARSIIFQNSHLFLVLVNSSKGCSKLMLARARETGRVLARQPGVSGRCTPMLACQREFDAPRHPLTSFYPTSQSRVIPPHTVDTNTTTGVDQIKFSSFENWIGISSRSCRWNCFLRPILIVDSCI